LNFIYLRRFSINLIFIGFYLSISFFGFTQNQKQIPLDKKERLEEYISLAKESENTKDFNQAAFYYTQAANINWSYSQFQGAVEQYKKALEMTERLGNLNGISVINSNLGMIYSELKEYKISRTYFQSSLEVSKKMGRKQDVASSLFNIGNSFCESDNFNEAIPLLEESKLIAQELSDTKILRNCYSLLTNAYDKVGDRKKSTEYFNLFAALTKKIQEDDVRRQEEAARLKVDSANTRVKQIALIQQATKQELDDKSSELEVNKENLKAAEQISIEQQMQIDLLNKEKELTQARIRQQELMRNVYLIIIISFLLISGITTYGFFVIKKANRLLTEKNIEISKQKDEIANQANELKELNALKDKLFSIISHDLRSPLFSLIGMLKLAKEGHFSESEQKEILDDLSKNVEYNTELLENLLKWANSQLKGSVINPSIFDIRDIVSNKIALYSKTANSKGIVIKNSVSEGSSVYADKDMVEIVVRNLLTNALKFSETGDEVIVRSTQKDGHVALCVEDNGVGITQDIFSKLFGNQIITSRGTNNEKGTGLGLILCRDFVTLNGGEIWAESEVNMGSKFYFTLPTPKH